jgi:hypothetical protein
MEMVVAMAIFGIFTFILLSLTNELAFWERRLKLDFNRHPQVIAVISRMRRDVLDAQGNDPYLAAIDGYTNGPQTLVIERVMLSGGLETVVWDLSAPGAVVRRAYAAGEIRQWRARGLPPRFDPIIRAVENPNPKGAWGVRLQAFDSRGGVAIDQIFYPRPTNR